MSIQVYTVPAQVDAFDPANDWILVSDRATLNGSGYRAFSTVAAAVGAYLSLDSLSNVTVPTPSAGDLLRYDGAAWVNASLSTAGIAAAGPAVSSGLTMATARLLGRTTASTGAIEEISIGSGLSLSGGVLSATGGGGGSGTVTSVNISSTDLSVTGGPITSSGVLTVNVLASAITNAKLAQVATATFKGRVTAGTGDPEDLTVAQAKTLLDLAGTNTGDQTITLTGAVTGSGVGSFATTLADDAVTTTKIAPNAVLGSKIANNNVTNVKLSNVATATFKGRLTAGTGAPEDLTVPQAQGLLGISGTNTGDQTITLTGDVTGSGTGSFAATIADGSVSLTKMSNLAANSFIGNNTGSAATPLALTIAQATAMLGVFTATLQGAVPASGGGSLNFLRADGTWQAPPGGGSGPITSSAFTMSTARMLGRTTASTGAIEEISIGSGLLLSGGVLSATGGGGGISGSIATSQVAFGSGTNAIQGSATFTFGATAGLLLAPTAVSSGTQTALTLTGAANTGLTASTEAVDVRFNLARTVQFAVGALATQRAFLIEAPTYAFAAASTLTTAATLAISGSPVAGTNATITNRYALWVQSGISDFDGPVWTAASTASAAGFRMLAGTPPATPVDGDMWLTTSALFGRANGVTSNLTRIVFALTDAVTIAVDAAAGDVLTVTLGGNRTIAAPTNPVNGKLLLFRIRQDATGTRTLTWNAVFQFTTELPAPTLSTAANTVDYVGFVYDAVRAKWDCIAYAIGYP